MMRWLGLDGYGKGWVVVEIDDHRRQMFSVATLHDERLQTFDRMAIDMPIGLPARGYRDCDRDARQMLGAHRSRVFVGARRCLIETNWTKFEQANEALHADSEPGISLQLWHILPKMKEVDRFVRSHSGRQIVETHPELVFLRLKGDQLGSKKTKDGIADRVRLLRGAGFDEIDEWVEQRRPQGAKRDDVLDACAAAIAARDLSTDHVVPRGNTPHDDCDLPMRIWY